MVIHCKLSKVVTFGTQKVAVIERYMWPVYTVDLYIIVPFGSHNLAAIER